MSYCRIGYRIGLIAALCLSAPSIGAESLYSESTFRPLASDKRAYRPGDALTILVLENSSATTTADTSLRRKNEVNAQGSLDQHSHAAGVSLNNDFGGGGRVQRSGKLLAQITATVTSIAPNGDLWVSGEQVVEINSDKQQIKVEGRVRPLDISDTNTVQSNRLADARISYIGDGDLAARQKPGWLSRLLVWLGL